MIKPKKSEDIGMKRGRILSNLSAGKQIKVISEGLPILMASASDLLEGAEKFNDDTRTKELLENHALEEIAKILILIDVIRCPKKIRSQKIGKMMKWFYDHLARLIYVEAQKYKPPTVNHLQEYIDNDRGSHYLEGAIGEYIAPNQLLWKREGCLYADLITYEDGEPRWHDPVDDFYLTGWVSHPAWDVGKALEAFGVFTEEGLSILSDVWGDVHFEGSQDWSATRNLTEKMLVALEKKNLITENATDDHIRALYSLWQLPMYEIEFSQVNMSLDELRVTRDKNLWNESGY